MAKEKYVIIIVDAIITIDMRKPVLIILFFRELKNYDFYHKIEYI